MPRNEELADLVRPIVEDLLALPNSAAMTDEQLLTAIEITMRKLAKWEKIPDGIGTDAFVRLVTDMARLELSTRRNH